MNSIEFIKKQVLRILAEAEDSESEASAAEEKTHGPGRGGWKGSIQDTGALAKDKPKELMKRLGVSSVSEKTDVKNIFKILEQAVSGTEAMKSVYGSPKPRKNTNSGHEGIRIPISVIPSRDGLKYIEHTIVGAQNAGYVKFSAPIQVELLGEDVLVYVGDKPRSWGKTKSKKTK